jgi:1-acyl-sn-glycerol-3-phosphate acyltransferase
MARSGARILATVPSSADASTVPAGDPTWVPDRPLSFRGSRLAQWALQRAGWEVVFNGLPARQGVLIAYPHTSNWDFVLGVLTKWALGLHLNFWGKDTLFKVPLFGAWLRWLGGIAVDRQNARGIVGSMAQRFHAARQADDFLWLALSPEGTRKYQSSWRSGFYQVATQAQLPLGLVFFDYGRKRVGVDHFLHLCGDPRRDMAAIATYYAGVQGKRPEQAAPIQIKTL